MPRKPTQPSHGEVIRERWLRGRLGYKLHAGQKKIREALDRALSQLFVGECSRQLGKTYLEAVIALEEAFSKPRAKVKIGTAFHTDLLEFIIPAFDAVMDDCPEDLRPIFKVQGSKFIVPHNKSEIKLVGLDRKPNGLRGTVIDLIILAEAAFISNLHYLFKSVIIPATTHRPDCRVLMLTTPPETPAHEFLDYVEKAEFEGGYIKLTIYDNPMVDETTIARLMKESGGPNSTTWRREYLCEHITDASLAIISDWLEEYVQEVNHDDYYPFYHKYQAMDLGVRDHTASLFAHYDFIKAKLFIEDEFSIHGFEMNTKILQANLKRKELETWTNYKFAKDVLLINEESDIQLIDAEWKEKSPKVYRRVADNNNPLLLQDLSWLHGIHFTATDKGRLEEMVNAVKILARDGGIIVSPNCKQLKGCLKYGVWDKNRDKFARSNVYGHFDALAALVYLVRNLDKSTNPIPPTFQVDFDNQILFQHRQESTSAKNLRNAFGLKTA